MIPDSEILKQQSNFLKKDTIWTENDNAQVSLLKMLHEIKAPLYMFDKIMSWAADANTSSYIFSSVFRRRDRLIRDLYDRLDMHGLKPKKNKFTLHDGSEDTVVTFDFKQSLLSLLCDSSLMSDENMLFSGDTPYDSSTLNCEIYSDINSSDRYHQI